jgi:cell wall assembly regulator SMI1
MESNNLRGRIISMYHSVLSFGKALNWSSRKTYDIVNGKQEATSKDIEAMCAALDVTIPEEMRLLFFSS